MRINVLRTIRVFYPRVTGPANQAYWISRGLADSGIASTVVTTQQSNPPAPPEEEMDGFTVCRLDEAYGFMAYRLLTDSRAILNARPDLIHVHCYRDRLCTLASRLARRLDVPYVLQPHGALRMYRYLLRAPMQWPYRIYDALTFKREVLSADRVVVATDQEAEDALQFGVCPDRVIRIPVGADACDTKRRQKREDGNGIRALFVGRISPGRNVEQIIDALGLIRDEVLRGDFRLSIVGPAEASSSLHNGNRYLQKLKDRIDHHGLKSVVEFRGALYGRSLSQAYLQSDLFLYTSDYENFGQTVLEAAAHGCPVVATPTGVARELVQDGQTGYLVPFGDHAALAARINELLRSPQQLPRMSDKIHQQAKVNYHWPDLIARYRELYASLRS